MSGEANRWQRWLAAAVAAVAIAAASSHGLAFAAEDGSGASIIEAADLPEAPGCDPPVLAAAPAEPVLVAARGFAVELPRVIGASDPLRLAHLALAPKTSPPRAA